MTLTTGIPLRGVTHTYRPDSQEVSQGHAGLVLQSMGHQFAAPRSPAVEEGPRRTSDQKYRIYGTRVTKLRIPSKPNAWCDGQPAARLTLSFESTTWLRFTQNMKKLSSRVSKTRTPRTWNGQSWRRCCLAPVCMVLTFKAHTTGEDASTGFRSTGATHAKNSHRVLQVICLFTKRRVPACIFS